MDNRSRKGQGKSRLAAPEFRQDALAKQARSQQAKGPLSPMPQRGRTQASAEYTPIPPTGSQRRAAKRAEKAKQNEAATKIQAVFKAFQARKAARADLQASIKGDLPDRLAKLVGQSYVDAGLLQTATKPISKTSGRLAGDWSGGVDTQKGHLNKTRAANPIGTTHHTVSDHFLGFVNAAVKRLESRSSTEQASARNFRDQVKKDSLYAGPDPERALFQVRQNLTFGPASDHIKGDPGIGFDATFAPSTTPGLARDWDARSTKIRPVHNLGLLLKSGHFELTS